MELNKVPIEKLIGIGSVYARRLKKLNIETAEDLLYYFPFRYEDYSLVSKIIFIQPGETVTVQGIIKTIKNEYTRRGKKIQKAQIEDDSGIIDVIWYNQPFLVKTLKEGERVCLSGKVEWFGKKKILESPQYEIIRQDGILIHTGRLVPIYSETYGVSSKWLRSRIAYLLKTFSLKDFLPKEIIRRYNLLPLNRAIKEIHFPSNRILAERAQERLAFDELLIIQLGSLKRKVEWQKKRVGNPFKISEFREKIREFMANLPFELTLAQRKAIGQILTDLSKNQPMNRLLEGDVGSGKTVVATIAIYLSYLNKFQSVFMAPTEILAFQHFQTVNNFLSSSGVKVGLYTGSKKTISWTDFKNMDVLIGTHAVLSEKLKFERLGLVVIDEQHRFGVSQRAIIRKKGFSPHFLTMTATPIPRTVALTFYGELDLSFLDELPKGRQRITTWVVPPEKRTAAYNWIREKITTAKKKRGEEQVFIICPLIEESETLESVRAATIEYQRLKKDVFPDFNLGLLHGKMKPNDKEKAINQFKYGQTDILVSTPVVEVGIDIPNATIMLIEGAERFGLAQLHQLRGRVGRGKTASFCLLFSNAKSSKAIRRLKSLEKNYIGAKLAEIDLRMRGPGEIYGTKQHGIPNLKVASLSNRVLIEKTNQAAKEILEKSPSLSSFPLLQAELKKYTIRMVSPD